MMIAFAVSMGKSPPSLEKQALPAHGAYAVDQAIDSTIVEADRRARGSVRRNEQTGKNLQEVFPRWRDAEGGGELGWERSGRLSPDIS